MRLFFDVGNTRIKWVLEEAGSFTSSGVINHESDGFDSLGSLLGCLKIESVWASSVASPVVNQKLEAWVERSLNLITNWASVKQTQLGIENCYEDLSKLGVDRWMALIGADDYRKSQGLQDAPIIIVDAGTAVTIELLDEGCQYRGGAILPGVVLMHDSLVGRTQGVASNFMSIDAVIGQSTQECVNAGVRYGVVGAVERVVNQICELPDVDQAKVLLLITGGDADFINQNSTLNFIVLPQLVLSGLLGVANDGGKR